MMTDRILNYDFQSLDPRDFKFLAKPQDNLHVFSSLTTKSSTTTKITLSAPPSFAITKLPAILDQGSIGSCVSNSFAFSIKTKTNN